MRTRETFLFIVLIITIIIIHKYFFLILAIIAVYFLKEFIEIKRERERDLQNKYNETKKNNPRFF